MNSIDLVRKEAQNSAKEIQDKLDSRHMEEWIAMKYFQYDDAERTTKIGEQVFIKHTFDIDWNQCGSYCLKIQPNITDTIISIMKGYVFSPEVQINLYKKGKVVEVVYVFDKEYQK